MLWDCPAKPHPLQWLVLCNPQLGEGPSKKCPVLSVLSLSIFFFFLFCLQTFVSKWWVEWWMSFSETSLELIFIFSFYPSSQAWGAVTVVLLASQEEQTDGTMVTWDLLTCGWEKAHSLYLNRATGLFPGKLWFSGVCVCVCLSWSENTMCWCLWVDWTPCHNNSLSVCVLSAAGSVNVTWMFCGVFFFKKTEISKDAGLNF